MAGSLVRAFWSFRVKGFEPMGGFPNIRDHSTCEESAIMRAILIFKATQRLRAVHVSGSGV